MTVAPTGVPVDAALRTARTAATCFAGDAEARDPLTGDALPRSLAEVLRSVRRIAAEGRHPLPSDGLQQLVEFVLKPLEEVTQRPRARIDRSHALMPIHRIREFDAKCTDWIGRQPGRTIREKLAGKATLLGVRREFSGETNENILVAKLLHGLLPRIDARLREAASGAFDPVDPLRLDVLRRCERLCSRALRSSEFGAIDHRKPVRPNNVLLGDRRYLKLWRGWRWLRELDRIDATEATRAPSRFRQAIFAALCGELAAGPDVAFGDSFVLIPGASVDDLARSEPRRLSHHRDRFRWDSWRSAEFIALDGGSARFDRVTLDSASISLQRSRAAGSVILRAGDPERVTECTLEFPEEPAASGGGLRVRLLEGDRVLFDGPADLAAIREITRTLMRQHGLEPPEPETARPVPPSADIAAVGIDLASGAISTGDVATGVPDSLSRFAVGFSTAGDGDAASGMHWLPGSMHSTPDLFRKGVEFVPAEALLRSEILTPAIQQGGACILEGIRRNLERAGVGAGTKTAVVVPDSLGELAQSSLRRLSAAALGRTVHLSRTACLAMGWQARHLASSALAEDDVLIVLDGRSDGISLAFLQAKVDPALAEADPASRGLYWERRPAVVASDLDPSLAERLRRLSWRGMLVEYAKRVMASGPSDRGLTDRQVQDLAERLTDSGHVERVFISERSACVPLGDCLGCAVTIPFDASTARSVTRTFVDSILPTLADVFRHPLLDRMRRDLQSDGNRWHLLLADLPGRPGDGALPAVLETADMTDGKGLRKSIKPFGGSTVAERGRRLAAEGALHMLARAQSDLPAVVDWLPPLSLEMVADGHYREFTVLEERISSVHRSRSVDEFRVDRELELRPGVDHFAFPLFDGRAMRQDREVRIESEAFPLREPLRISLGVRYRYHEAQPYELTVTPVHGSLGSSIRATIGQPMERPNLVPPFPEPRAWTDPRVTERLGLLTTASMGWKARLESGLLMPALKSMFRNLRSLLDEGGPLSQAPMSVRTSVRMKIPFDLIERLAALDSASGLTLERSFPDQKARAPLRKWARKILGLFPTEYADRLLPATLEAYKSPTGGIEQIELFGLLVGDGRDARSPCMGPLIEEARAALRADDDLRCRSTLLTLAVSSWRHRDFVPALHAAAPGLVDLYLERAAGLIEIHGRKAVEQPSESFRNLRPQCIRAIGETCLAFMRLREGPNRPAACAPGSPLLTRLGIAFCDAERKLLATRAEGDRPAGSLRLKSYLRFEFERKGELHETSDLAYVLRHYLNGGSYVPISIVGRSDDDDE